MPDVKFLASTVREILGGANSKSGSRESHLTSFDLILHFSLALTATRLRA